MQLLFLLSVCTQQTQGLKNTKQDGGGGGGLKQLTTKSSICENATTPPWQFEWSWTKKKTWYTRKKIKGGLSMCFFYVHL